MRKPQASDRWLALGGLLLVMAAVWWLLVRPVWWAPLQEVSQEVAVLQERKARLQAELDNAGLVADRLVQLQQRWPSGVGFLPHGRPESAGAALLQRVEETVLQASPGNRSCRVSARSPLPPAPQTGTYVEVSVQVRLRCGVSEFAQVVQLLESQTPRLFLGNVTILAQQGNLQPGESGSGLDVSLDVSGYLDPVLVQSITEVGHAP